MGATVSSTFTVKEQPPLLPAPSEAVHMTLVVPTGKLEPDAGSHVTVGLGSHASVAVTTNSTTVPPVPVHSAVRFPPHVTLGPTVSRTATVNEHVLVFPLLSEAAQVTVVTPEAKVEPEGGWQVTVAFVSHPSVTVATN